MISKYEYLWYTDARSSWILVHDILLWLYRIKAFAGSEFPNCEHTLRTACTTACPTKGNTSSLFDSIRNNFFLPKLWTKQHDLHNSISDIQVILSIHTIKLLVISSCAITYSLEQKGTCHGISAAAGKLGAILGAYSFVYMTDEFCTGNQCDDGDSTSAKDQGIQLSFGVCALIGFIGLVWSRVRIPHNIFEMTQIHASNYYH